MAQRMSFPIHSLTLTLVVETFWRSRMGAMPPFFSARTTVGQKSLELGCPLFRAWEVAPRRQR